MTFDRVKLFDLLRKSFAAIPHDIPQALGM